MSDIKSFDVKIYIEKEKRAIFNKIKNIALYEDGIIFGGMVREEIIVEFYKNKFNKYVSENTNEIVNNRNFLYWDTSFHPESSSRTIIPVDMDVFFNSVNNVDNFIEKLKKLNFDSIDIISEIPSVNYSQIHINKKIQIKYYLGKTFTYKGKLITIDVDCLYSNKKYNSDPQLKYETVFEPPFNNLDFLCNSFIRTKEGIRLSKCTGTKMDFMNIIEKAQISVGIINQIVNFKTEIALNSNSNKNEYILVGRIIKMLEKTNTPKWNILNLPFITSKITIDDTGKTCLICHDELCENNSNKNYKVSFESSDSEGNKITSCEIHKECMINMIKHQLADYKGKFICPYKSQLKFTEKPIDFDKFININ